MRRERQHGASIRSEYFSNFATSWGSISRARQSLPPSSVTAAPSVGPALEVAHIRKEAFCAALEWAAERRVHIHLGVASASAEQVHHGPIERTARGSTSWTRTSACMSSKAAFMPRDPRPGGDGGGPRRPSPHHCVGEQRRCRLAGPAPGVRSQSLVGHLAGCFSCRSGWRAGAGRQPCGRPVAL